MTEEDPLAHLDFHVEGMDEVTPVVVHRWALYDVAVNAKELAEAVGLPPISVEQDVSEREASLKRLLKVNSLDPAISTHTAFLASVFLQVQRAAAQQQGLPPVPDESWQAAYDHLRHMLYTSGTSLLSALVELGALHVDESWQQPSENGSR